MSSTTIITQPGQKIVEREDTHFFERETIWYAKDEVERQLVESYSRWFGIEVKRVKLGTVRTEPTWHQYPDVVNISFHQGWKWAALFVLFGVAAALVATYA